MHGALLALLFFGVQWQSHPPEAASVDLVRSVPAIPTQAVQPPPPRPEPEPRPEPKPVEEKPKPVEEKPVPVEKPDIALKEPEKKKIKKPEEPKPEQSKPEKKPEKKPEPEKKTEPEKKPDPKKQDKKPDAQKPDPAPADRITSLLAQSDRAARDAQMQNKLAQEAGRARSAAAGADRSGANDAWKSKVVSKIRGLMVLPPGLKGRPTAEFEVELYPDGRLRAEPRLVKSSGNSALDQIIKGAIKAAEPLPQPPPDAIGKPNTFKFDPLDPDY
jgi:colicin import membrane protein